MTALSRAARRFAGGLAMVAPVLHLDRGVESRLLQGEQRDRAPIDLFHKPVGPVALSRDQRVLVRKHPSDALLIGDPGQNLAPAGGRKAPYQEALDLQVEVFSVHEAVAE